MFPHPLSLSTKGPTRGRVANPRALPSSGASDEQVAWTLAQFDAPRRAHDRITLAQRWLDITPDAVTGQPRRLYMMFEVWLEAARVRGALVKSREGWYFLAPANPLAT